MQNKVYSLWGKAVDKDGVTHYVTVVGLYNQRKERTTEMMDGLVTCGDCNKEQEALMFVEKKTRMRTLALGASICHPSDEFNEAVGVSVAKSRAKNNPIGVVKSEYVTMLNEDACTMLVFNELNHITKHIDEYIEKY